MEEGNINGNPSHGMTRCLHQPILVAQSCASGEWEGCGFHRMGLCECLCSGGGGGYRCAKARLMLCVVTEYK